jgi:hypothetical protein
MLAPLERIGGSDGQHSPYQRASTRFRNATIICDVLREEGTMRFALTLEGDTLTGQATRERDGQQQTAKLNLKREK